MAWRGFRGIRAAVTLALIGLTLQGALAEEKVPARCAPDLYYYQSVERGETKTLRCDVAVYGGMPVALPELYELREKLFQDHVSYQQGLLYFLANDPRVPKELQARVRGFGLDPDEFKDTGHWPHQLYVREGRRMVSAYVMTQANGESTRSVADSVGLASYPMDSHHCHRGVVIRDGKTTVRNEGNFFKGCPQPYPISYRSIVPKKEQCQNLLVPLCLSASHVAYGSIRMEPVFMILGQSAGTAASLAIEDKVPVQEVAYTNLKARLLGDGQVLR